MDRKKLRKKVIVGFAVLLVIAQLLQPTKNISAQESPNDIGKVYQMPVDVHSILNQKCYDCHSNNTNYPWYVNIQPIGWWMASHVSDGKRHLNFSEFKTYNEKRATRKLEELSEAVTEGWMPIDTYVWMHGETKITPEDATKINVWIQSLGVVTKKE
jgi:hypothetical protein